MSESIHIHIYCDESCHLENDGMKAMVLGALWCPASHRKFLARKIKALKAAHGLPPESKRKGYGFWHLISEAPDQGNRDEDERIPDLRRCERVRWVAWCIQNAHEAGFSWWENERGRETHVVIWAEEHDFAVVLAKRLTQQGPRFYLLKTAYCLRSHAIRKFTKERDAWRAAQKD